METSEKKDRETISSFINDYTESLVASCKKEVDKKNIPISFVLLLEKDGMIGMGGTELNDRTSFHEDIMSVVTILSQMGNRLLCGCLSFYDEKNNRMSITFSSEIYRDIKIVKHESLGESIITPERISDMVNQTYSMN